LKRSAGRKQDIPTLLYEFQVRNEQLPYWQSSMIYRTQPVKPSGASDTGPGRQRKTYQHTAEHISDVMRLAYSGIDTPGGSDYSSLSNSHLGFVSPWGDEHQPAFAARCFCVVSTAMHFIPLRASHASRGVFHHHVFRRYSAFAARGTPLGWVCLQFRGRNQ
jgi:hypothetical protein